MRSSWISLSAYRPGGAALSATVEVSCGVDESMRQRSVGTAMLTHMIEQTKTLGHRIVFAIVFDTNAAPRRLLEKCGFKKRKLITS
jgi:L-amino acid N-acyltransferase YncA